MERYPLTWPEGWPRTLRRQTNARFKTTFSAAHRNLLSELKRLGASAVVVSSWLPLKNNGEPRAESARMKLTDPGVAVYFTLRARPMVMARDTYTSVHDNLHSIGHAIAHLRGLERHGGAVMMERAFSGFLALPAPGQEEHWSRVMGSPGNWRELSPETQRSWINGRFQELYAAVVDDHVMVSRLRNARANALANIGQPIASG